MPANTSRSCVTRFITLQSEIPDITALQNKPILYSAATGKAASFVPVQLSF